MTYLCNQLLLEVKQIILIYWVHMIQSVEESPEPKKDFPEEISLVDFSVHSQLRVPAYSA
jgi:hypothetical protein